MRWLSPRDIPLTLQPKKVTFYPITKERNMDKFFYYKGQKIGVPSCLSQYSMGLSILGL